LLPGGPRTHWPRGRPVPLVKEQGALRRRPWMSAWSWAAVTGELGENVLDHIRSPRFLFDRLVQAVPAGPWAKKA
jgi:hypothetical protein